MTPRLSARVASALGTLAALPAFAHVTSGPTPHWHAGDIWGVLAVVALTGAAIWLDRRTRR